MKLSLNSKSGKKRLKAIQRRRSSAYTLTMDLSIATISLMSYAEHLESRDIALVLTLPNRMGFQNV